MVRQLSVATKARVFASSLGSSVVFWLLFFGFWKHVSIGVLAATPQPYGAASSKTSTTQSPSHQQDPAVPIIDLSRSDDDPTLIRDIARACQSPGFFQVTHHGISLELMQAFRHQCALYFQLPLTTKLQWKRHAQNARGFFHDEYTQQQLDWKQALDVGVPGSRNWNLPDQHDSNQNCCDGINYFPPTSVLSDYRRVAVDYFQACEQLSQRLARLMALGLQWLQQEPEEDKNDSPTITTKSLSLVKNDPFLLDMAANHSSYLRTNYYPPYQDAQQAKEMPGASSNSTLGISPHKDAGFLTILLQDDHCHSLQVPAVDNHDDHTTAMPTQWKTVTPVPGALTINTGDMAQIWSNNAYRAPLHRVLTSDTQPRYSAPFFYNPPYHATLQPMTHDAKDSSQGLYHPVLWAYFRAVRFAGDWTDLGVEIQIQHFLKQNTNADAMLHRKLQTEFQARRWDRQTFDVQQYAMLLKSVDHRESKL